MQRIRLIFLLLAAALLGTAVSAGPASARGNVLPDETYNAIVQVDAELSDLAKTPKSELSDQQRLADAKAICRIYAADDPLRRNLRDRCLAYRATEQLLDRTAVCKTWRGCLRLVKQVGASHERSYRLMAQASRIASSTVPEGACRTALVFTSDELRYQRLYGRMETAYIRAGFDDDKRAMKAIEKRFERQVRELKILPGDQRHEQIVTHC